MNELMRSMLAVVVLAIAAAGIWFLVQPVELYNDWYYTAKLTPAGKREVKKLERERRTAQMELGDVGESRVKVSRVLRRLDHIDARIKQATIRGAVNRGYTDCVYDSQHESRNTYGLSPGKVRRIKELGRNIEILCGRLHGVN